MSIHDSFASSATGAQAYILGYVDGYEGAPADTLIIRSEYRRDYLQGWAEGHRRIVAESHADCVVNQRGDAWREKP